MSFVPRLKGKEAPKSKLRVKAPSLEGRTPANLWSTIAINSGQVRREVMDKHEHTSNFQRRVDPPTETVREVPITDIQPAKKSEPPVAKEPFKLDPPVFLSQEALDVWDDIVQAQPYQPESHDAFILVMAAETYAAWKSNIAKGEFKNASMCLANFVNVSKNLGMFPIQKKINGTRLSMMEVMLKYRQAMVPTDEENALVGRTPPDNPLLPRLFT